MKVLKVEKNVEYKLTATYYRISHIKDSIFNVNFYNKNIEKECHADLMIQLGRTKEEKFRKSEYFEFNERKNLVLFIAEELKKMQTLEISCFFN